jgi:hypothetical protein
MRIRSSMSVIALSLLLAIGSTVTVSSQDLEKPIDAVIDFSEYEFDFGYMPKGTMALHTYYIRNRGTDTLRIIKVSPSCGCTSAPLDKSNIGLDDEAQLDVFFASKKFSGVVRKKITILSNDPSDPFTDIAFSATVDRPHPLIEAEPNLIESGLEAPEKPGKTFTITLKNKAKDPVGLSIVSQCDPYLEAKLSRETIQPDGTVQLMVKFLEPHGSPNTPWYSVTLETDDPQKSRLTIPLLIPTT